MGSDGVAELTVHQSTSLWEAMQRIDRNERGIVVVEDDRGRLVGTASDGDIRRGILGGSDLETPVSEVMNDDPVSLTEDEVDRTESSAFLKELRDSVSEHRTVTVPVTNGRREVVDVLRVSQEGELLRDEPSGSVDSVLVIGGAGYLGSVLCRMLVERGYEVKALDKLLYGHQGVSELMSHERFSLVEADMRSISAIMDGIEGVDAVVHLGALVGDPASSIDPKKTLELNYHASKLAASVSKYHQVNRFVFASTCSVYGAGDGGELLTERSDLNPVSLYAQTKIDSEKVIMGMADANFSPTILRMATIYGLSPRMRFDLVVNILTAKAYETGTIPIFGGDQYRPNVHVADAARAYIDCLEAPIEDVSGEVFNVGSNDQNYRIEEVGRIVSECFPDAEVDRQREKTDDRSYRVDFSKIRETLGYDVEHTVGDGCREIRRALELGRFEDYQNQRYNNFKVADERIPGEL